MTELQAEMCAQKIGRVAKNATFLHIFAEVATQLKIVITCNFLMLEYDNIACFGYNLRKDPPPPHAPSRAHPPLLRIWTKLHGAKNIINMFIDVQNTLIYLSF